MLFPWTRSAFLSWEEILVRELCPLKEPHPEVDGFENYSPRISLICSLRSMKVQKKSVYLKTILKNSSNAYPVQCHVIK